MGRVSYNYFDQRRDYPDKPDIRRRSSFKVSQYDFSKYAILNGKYGNHTMSYNAKGFYASICKMAVKKEKNFFVISDDYKNAETSYKTAISFAMGMVATRIIANKIYNVARLYHFTESGWSSILKHGKMAPDWFGLDQHGRPFLFESKGTSQKRIDKKTIEHAKNQLKNVKEIRDSSSGKQYFEQNISKHIICSCFDKYSKIDGVWCIHDVDPVGSGNTELRINLDEECFKYYQAFVLYVDSLNTLRRGVVIKNQNYYSWVYENERYCILEKIYDLVKSGQFSKQNSYYRFNEFVDEELKGMEYSVPFSYDISSYEDGIIVCSPETFPEVNNKQRNVPLFIK